MYEFFKKRRIRIKDKEIEKKLLKRITGQPLIIYGAGIIGRRFLQWANIMKLESQILNFLVTLVENNSESIHNIPIKGVDSLCEVKGDTLVIIAASVKTHKDMMKNLNAFGHNNYVLIDDEINGYLIRFMKRNKRSNLYICLTYYHVLIALAKSIIFEQCSDIILGEAVRKL